MENKNNTTFYFVGLKDIKKRELKSKLSFDSRAWNSGLFGSITLISNLLKQE